MMKRRTTVKAVKLPEAKERHKEMMNNLTTGKALIISEAEKRHKKDVQRIEDTLKTAPDKVDNYILQTGINSNDFNRLIKQSRKVAA